MPTHDPVYTLDLREHHFVSVRSIAYRLPWAPDPPDPTPTDSPLKVWDGSAWVIASAPPTS
jgi:hypothetical protein